MIVKVVQKESDGNYNHELLVEADRVEIQQYREAGDWGEADWTYTDQPHDLTGSRPAIVVRAWHAWPQDKYEIGVVRSGRVFVMNDAGKTVDKYVV